MACGRGDIYGETEVITREKKREKMTRAASMVKHSNSQTLKDDQLTSITEMDISQEARSQRGVRKSIKGTPDLENKNQTGPGGRSGEEGGEERRRGVLVSP
jgi:hypothetical protein